MRWPVGEAVFAFSPHVRVYLASQPVDMRAGHDGLFAIVKSWDLNPFSGDLFAFVGKRGDRAKILVWHRGGFLLMYKRLEKGKFRIPTIAPGARTAMLDATELAMLLDGIDVTRVKRPALWELNWDGAFSGNERPKGLICHRGGFRVLWSAGALWTGYCAREYLLLGGLRFGERAPAPEQGLFQLRAVAALRAGKVGF